MPFQTDSIEYSVHSKGKLSAKEPLHIVDDHQPIRRTIADSMRSLGY